MRYRVQCWTGPTLVAAIAEKMREAGLAVTCEGTERVYAVVEATEPGAAGHNLCAALERTHGTSFGLRPLVLGGAE